MRWSIRTKILAVLSALLLMAMFAHLIMAERIFREDKILLLFDTNRSNAERMADQLDNSVRRVVDKMELLGQLGTATARKIFENDDELLAFQLVTREHLEIEIISERKARKAGIRTTDLRFATTSTGGTVFTDHWVVENRSVPGAILFQIRVPVHIPGAGPAFAQAVIDGRKWQERFSQNQNLALSFAVSSSGRALLHPRVSFVTDRIDLTALPLIRLGRDQGFMRRQSEFLYENRPWFGVVQKTRTADLLVVSMTDKETALAAVNLLLEKTLIFSAIVITVALLFTVLFANSLSTPLLGLVRAAGEIAKGRFDVRVPVDSKDEIGTLATAFDRMAVDLKASREQLEEYSHTLELKVQSRTRELEEQHEVLLRTTRLAAVGEAAGSAAHEVLNPLTAIISRLEAISLRLRHFYGGGSTPLATLNAITGAWAADFRAGGPEHWIEAMKRPSRIDPAKTLAQEDLENAGIIAAQFEKFGEALLADIETLSREAHRISRIVQNMRGLSRLSKNRTEVPLSDFLADCLKSHQDILKRYRIRSEFLTGEVACRAHVDTDELRQVIGNLITNAVDAIEERRQADRNIDLEGLLTFALDANENAARIRIRDNGIGVPSDLWEKIFDSHFTTKGAKGTGLGLGICRQFVAEAGGTVSVASSRPGEYTEFELIIPLLLPQERSDG